MKILSIQQFDLLSIYVLLTLLISCQNSKDQQEEQIIFDTDYSVLLFDDTSAQSRVNFTASTPWSIELFDSDNTTPKWIEVSPLSGESGYVSLDLNLLSNELTYQRIATLVVNTNTKQYKIIVKQNGSEVLLISPDDIYVESQAGSFVLNIVCNIHWSVQNVPSWVLIDPVNGSGNREIVVQYESNTDRSQREAKINFVSTDGTNKVLNITQKEDDNQLKDLEIRDL